MKPLSLVHLSLPVCAAGRMLFPYNELERPKLMGDVWQGVSERRPRRGKMAAVLPAPGDGSWRG